MDSPTLWCGDARVSFEEIEAFVNELCRVRFKDTKDLPIVIVGNKGDVPEEEREVSKEEAIRFAEENGCPLIGRSYLPTTTSRSNREAARPTTHTSMDLKQRRAPGRGKMYRRCWTSYCKRLPTITQRRSEVSCGR